MTTAGKVPKSAPKPAPPAFTSDAAVREALARYLTAVAQYLHGTGPQVSGPTLAPPGELLAGTLLAPATNSKDNRGLVVARWNEETGWSTRRDHPNQPTSIRRYLHQRLVPAPALAAQFITAALHSDVPPAPTPSADVAPAVAGLAVRDYPRQFRYRTGRAEHLLTQLTRAI
jgi:hypothetical protein